MVRVDPAATIQTENDEANPDQVKVKIIGDLFSAALFIGLIRPDDCNTSTFNAPRIFQVVDIGWDLAPHNLVVNCPEYSPIETPPGLHMYTINVEAVPQPAFFSAAEPRTAIALTSHQQLAMRILSEKANYFLFTYQ
jgi:hypothetical protein